MLIRPAELEKLISYAKRAKLGIVEIGCLDGETSAILAKNAKVKLFSIDPLVPDSMDSNVLGSEIRIRENTKLLKNFTFIKDFSYNAVSSWAIAFDLIFIDGDHAYEAVKKDYEDWYPLLEPGGYIAFHDSGATRGGPERWDGPSRLTDELIDSGEHLTYIETVESLTIFEKNY